MTTSLAATLVALRQHLAQWRFFKTRFYTAGIVYFCCLSLACKPANICSQHDSQIQLRLMGMSLNVIFMMMALDEELRDHQRYYCSSWGGHGCLYHISWQSFHSFKTKRQPAGGAKGNVRGSPKLLQDLSSQDHECLFKLSWQFMTFNSFRQTERDILVWSKAVHRLMDIAIPGAVPKTILKA